MIDDLFCKKLALERVQFHIAQLSAMVLSNDAGNNSTTIERLSFKALLLAMDRDVRMILDMLPHDETFGFEHPDPL